MDFPDVGGNSKIVWDEELLASPTFMQDAGRSNESPSLREMYVAAAQIHERIPLLDSSTKAAEH